MFLLASFTVEEVVCFVVMCFFSHECRQRIQSWKITWVMRGRAQAPFCCHGFWLKQCVPGVRIFMVGFQIPTLWKGWWCGLQREVQAEIPWVLQLPDHGRNCSLGISFEDDPRNHFWKASLEFTSLCLRIVFARIQFSVLNPFRINQQTWLLPSAITL